MSDPVVVEIADGIVYLTLNRPEARNAVNRAMGAIVADALDELDARRDLRLAIITGADGVFSSGMDMKAYLNGERPSIPGRGLLGFAEKSPRKPVIAAVEGWALAAGFEIVLACDLVVASTTATFGLPEAKRGLVAAGGGLVRLSQRIPYAVGLELALTGRNLSVEEAHSWGLVNRIAPEGQALAIARELGAEIVANAPLSISVSKDIIRRARLWPSDEGFARQQELMEPLIGSPDIREGALAFAEKRQPVWRG